MPFKKYKLKKKDFEKTLKKGKSLKEDCLVLKTRENNLGIIRLGFLIPKKSFKKAVMRNKIKRMLREVMRKKMKEIKKGMDLLFIPLPGMRDKKFNEVKMMIEKILKKAKILK